MKDSAIAATLISLIVLLLALLSAPAFGSEEWIDLGREDAPVDQRDSRVVVEHSTLEELVLTISLPGMYVSSQRMADGDTYSVVRVPGSGFCGVGQPAAPALGNWILVPNGTEVEIVVDPGEPIVFENIRLPPVQPPVAEVEDAVVPAFTMDEAVYSRDADAPGVFAELDPISTMRGQACSVLRLYPCQFNPARGTLAVYPHLSVTVRFLGEAHPLAEAYRCDAYDGIMHRMTLNAEAILAHSDQALRESNPESTTHHARSEKVGWDYVILTVSKFAKPANDFAAWKKKCGFTPLVSVMPGHYTADDIRSAVTHAYYTWDLRPEYLLILGDAEHIPCHYKTWHPYNSQIGTNSQGYIATDSYYAQMTTNGMMLGDLLVGRVSVDTVAQAEARLDAIKNYEQCPPMDATYYNTATLCAEFQDGVLMVDPDGGKHEEKPDGMEDRRFTQTAEDIAVFLSSPKYKINKSVNRIYYAENKVTPTTWHYGTKGVMAGNFAGYSGKPGANIPSNLLRKNGFTWDGSATHIRSALNAGTFLLMHRGHGGRQNWKHPRLTPQHYACSYFNGFLPVVISINCQTGWFDNETDFTKSIYGGYIGKNVTTASEECFAEYWLRPTPGPGYNASHAGAVGVIAATRVSYSIYNDRFVAGCMDAMWNTYLPTAMSSGYPFSARMGSVLFCGKMHVNNYAPAGRIQKATNELMHWFGDPSMAIWTRKPNFVRAELPENWPHALIPAPLVIQNLQWISGNSEGSVPDGAKITITKDDAPNDGYAGSFDDEGNAIFPEVVLSDVGTYDVVVTAPGAVPYQGQFTCSPSSEGGILLSMDAHAEDACLMIRAADADLRGTGRLEAILQTSGNDMESVILIETPANSGMFVGSLGTAESSASANDNALQIEHEGDIISAAYFDGEWVEASAAML